MELFIRVKDGQAFEHPILGDNFRQAFPNINVNNLPSEFARFERIVSHVSSNVHLIRHHRSEARFLQFFVAISGVC